MRARLGEPAADALDVPDQEPATDESIQPDAAGDDVATRLLPGDLDPIGGERLERLRLDQRQLVAAAAARERALAAEVAVALEPASRDRLGDVDTSERASAAGATSSPATTPPASAGCAVRRRDIETELERRDHDALDERAAAGEQTGRDRAAGRTGRRT